MNYPGKPRQTQDILELTKWTHHWSVASVESGRGDRERRRAGRAHSVLLRHSTSVCGGCVAGASRTLVNCEFGTKRRGEGAVVDQRVILRRVLAGVCETLMLGRTALL